MANIAAGKTCVNASCLGTLVTCVGDEADPVLFGSCPCCGTVNEYPRSVVLASVSQPTNAETVAELRSRADAMEMADGVASINYPTNKPVPKDTSAPAPEAMKPLSEMDLPPVPEASPVHDEPAHGATSFFGDHEGQFSEGFDPTATMPAAPVDAHAPLQSPSTEHNIEAAQHEEPAPAYQSNVDPHVENGGA